MSIEAELSIVTDLSRPLLCGTVAALSFLCIGAPAAQARYQGTEPVCVTGTPDGETLSVRSEPRAGSRRKGRLDAGACGMNVESVEGNWTYIRGTDNRGNNIEGWVNNRFLRAASSGGGNAASDTGFPVDAASGGGVVRSGPGTNYKKITSTKEFEPVTVVRNTGVDMGGYPWFEIRLRGGMKGFQWGGVICSTDRPFAGTFDTCDNFRRSLNRNGAAEAAPDASPQGRRVEYSCNEGIPLIVTYIDQDGESYALYSHDSGPKNRVSAVPTGSGFDYTNGYHQLRGKGNKVDLIEGGNIIDSCTAE